jgi:hypothetical protein
VAPKSVEDAGANLHGLAERGIGDRCRDASERAESRSGSEVHRKSAGTFGTNSVQYGTQKHALSLSVTHCCALENIAKSMCCLEWRSARKSRALVF